MASGARFFASEAIDLTFDRGIECLRATGPHFCMTSSSVMVREFFRVTEQKLVSVSTSLTLIVVAFAMSGEPRRANRVGPYRSPTS